ncbi:MAG: 50S ribosomal protein L11 methyltransferase [Ruminiclostridium sp.]|nr:50S ribosomal protein L11 methyltransferase [Ruminiclostridium sp.]MBQ8843086.1 50S ribosomal protein L11 methyltransferase [Ruminiclostridium sp.]
MNFMQIDVYTESEAVNLLVMRLSELGINGFTIHDSADFEEFLENKDMNWDYVDDDLMGLKNVPTHITLYLQDNEQGLETLSELKGVLSELKAENGSFYGSLELKIDNVKEEDWANNWKQYYKPFNVGEKLIIKPSWENVTDIGNRKILEIDPASTFGTGQHHTTRLVMEKLEGVLGNNDKVLDLGCGSGILSIAAMLLGAESAVMVDIFKNAADTAAENMEKNGFTAEKYRAYCGNIIEDEALRNEIGTGYNVVVANIVADVIIAMSSLFRSFMKSDATLIVSGIIDERLEEVLSALKENGFAVKDTASSEGWNVIVLK